MLMTKNVYNIIYQSGTKLVREKQEVMPIHCCIMADAKSKIIMCIHTAK